MPAVFAEFLRVSGALPQLFPRLELVDSADERACRVEVERVKATVIKQIVQKCPGMETVAIPSGSSINLFAETHALRRTYRMQGHWIRTK